MLFYEQGLVLVYVTVVMVVMARQFSFLSSLDEDSERLPVVDTTGQTEMELVRNIQGESTNFV